MRWAGGGGRSCSILCKQDSTPGLPKMATLDRPLAEFRVSRCANTPQAMPARDGLSQACCWHPLQGLGPQSEPKGESRLRTSVQLCVLIMDVIQPGTFPPRQAVSPRTSRQNQPPFFLKWLWRQSNEAVTPCHSVGLRGYSMNGFASLAEPGLNAQFPRPRPTSLKIGKCESPSTLLFFLLFVHSVLCMSFCCNRDVAK